MALIEEYRWEARCAATIVGIVAVLALQKHLIRVSAIPARQSVNEQGLLNRLTTVPTIGSVRAVPASDAVALNAAQPVPPQPSEPGEVTVGPNGISNRYTLRRIDRRKETAHDVLVVSLHVESLATEGLVSPFESSMLEISGPDIPPIKPSTPFRSPVPSGNSRNQELAFSVPPNLNLDRATLRIHYFSYEREIPLNASLRNLSMTTQTAAPVH